MALSKKMTYSICRASTETRISKAATKFVNIVDPRQGALREGRQGAFGPGVLRAIFTHHYNMLVDKVSAFYKVPSGQGGPSGQRGPFSRARQIKSISKQVGGKVEGTKKVICSQMDLSYNFFTLIVALSKVLDFRGRFQPLNDLESEK